MNRFCTVREKYFSAYFRVTALGSRQGSRLTSAGCDGLLRKRLYVRTRLRLAPALFAYHVSSAVSLILIQVVLCLP